jgi:RHS repeat-associated protein
MDRATAANGKLDACIELFGDGGEMKAKVSKVRTDPFTHCNHRGDIIATRNGTTTTGTYGYSAIGNLQSVVGPDVCRFKFSSKERDASTGLSYYGARFYAPVWQRFINRDPIEEDGGLNLYVFVRNDPIDWIDILGLKNYQITDCDIDAQMKKIYKLLDIADPRDMWLFTQYIPFMVNLDTDYFYRQDDTFTYHGTKYPL